MIPYEQLAAALEDYAARVHGRAPTGYAPVVAAAPVAEPAHDSYDAETAGAAPAHEEPGALPAAPVYADHGEGHEEHTMVGGSPSTIRGDEPSNEIDIGDVLDDESQA